MGVVCNKSWPGPGGVSILGVTPGTKTQLNAVEQLKAYPAPRLVPATAKTFGRNIAWFNYVWVDGEDSPEGCSLFRKPGARQEPCTNASCYNQLGSRCWNQTAMDAMILELHTELATVWHYPFCKSLLPPPPEPSALKASWFAVQISRMTASTMRRFR